MMIWALILALLIAAVAITLNSSNPVPWFHKLRRLNAGAAHKAEWMAPDEVTAQVHADYLAAIHWLQESSFHSVEALLPQAAHYLTGSCLKRHQDWCRQYRSAPPRFWGVLRADHQIQVRHFSDDGARCLVVDRQTQRRMATYDLRTQKRLHTQDLGSYTAIYQLKYDMQAKRWKLETLIQELPAGWERAQSPQRVIISTSLPQSSGRDH